jgi:pimeloyl-ACP methyl ester carboxylesterase
VRGYVDTRWGQLQYSSTGSGEPTIVLLHETPLNYDAFRRLVPLLEPNFRVVAFDSPGYGESDGPTQPTTIEEYAKTLAEGIEALGLDRVVLYGVHTGASIAVQRAAVTLLERVAGLVVSGVPFYTDEVRAARVVPTIPTIADDGSHLLATFRWEPGAYDPEMRSRLVAGVTRDPRTAYQAFHAVYAYEPKKVLDRISGPVLLLSNPLDPLYEADTRFAAAVSGRQVVVHAEKLPVYWTQPEVVAEEITEFVQAMPH